MENFDKLKELVRGKIDTRRFEHTIGVVNCSAQLGAIYLPHKINKLCIAALLHDITKNLETSEHLEILNKYDYIVKSEDINYPAVLHGKSAAAIVENEFKEYADYDIVSAVYNHTVGNDNMSLFDKIIFFCDFIEPTRQYQSCIAIRNEFFDQIDKFESYQGKLEWLDICILKTLNSTLDHLTSRGSAIHSGTLKFRDCLISQCKIKD